MTRFRTLPLIAALSVLAIGPALAQSVPPAQTRALAPSGGAAGTLPNTFDGPVAPPVAPVRPAAPAPQVTDAEMAEAALRAIIGQMQSGALDPDLFTPDLGPRLQGQMATFGPLVQSFGALRSIEAEETAGDGPGQYRVTFDKAVTQWLVGLEEGGLVAALLFRPAPETPAAAAPVTQP
ncbi:MAG: hypothetical protein Q8S03_04955 [Brevundimonas sp.]|uniref:hypothetical protein n=1 Tax=Brevundimonas sp. TaxID=1871086 RepID=UPI0027364D49|nr:hypothetical protein [Brevundimonas sp.]MDP3404018.1 hypothetical protein [Brevundimonas sp.]